MSKARQRLVANPDTRAEHSDMSVTVVALVGLAVLLWVILAPLLLSQIYRRADADADRNLTINPPSPVLQLDPQSDLQKFRAQEEARLNSYGWVDRAKGIVHIPIDEAMKEVAARGIPDFPKAQP
jgi:hypothetical protein